MAEDSVQESENPAFPARGGGSNYARAHQLALGWFLIGCRDA